MLPKPLSRRSWSILLLAALALGAAGAVSYARLLRGDIDIAGAHMDLPRRAAPVMFDPNDKFAYDCRIQLNDWRESRERKIVYQGEEHVYDLYAYTDVTLDQNQRGVSSKNLAWKWIAVIVDSSKEEGEEGSLIEIPLASPPADAFSTAGHSVYLSRYGAESGKPRQVSLSGSVNLPVGSYFLTGNGRKDGDENSASLSLEATVEINRSGAPNPRGEPDLLWRRMFVECLKK